MPSGLDLARDTLLKPRRSHGCDTCLRPSSERGDMGQHVSLMALTVRAELVNGAPEIGGVPWQISFGTA